MHRYRLASAALLLGSTAIAAAQPAPPPEPTDSFYTAGNIVVRAAIAGVVPLIASSHIDGIGGNVDVTGGVMPEVDLSYFVTDNISLQLIATSTRHEISANDTSLTPLLGSKIDLASTYVLPPALVAQYHLKPMGHFGVYFGLGLDVMWPYDTSENKAVLPGTNTQIVQKVGLSNAIGPVLNVGVDYHISGPWFANLDYKQVFNEVTARIHTAVGLVKARVSLDPSVFSAGISYRF